MLQDGDSSMDSNATRTNVNFRVGATFGLEGKTIRGNAFSCTSTTPVTLSRGTLLFTSGDLANTTLGESITLSTGTYTNVPVSNFNVAGTTATTGRPSITFRGAGEINLSTLTIQGGRFTPNNNLLVTTQQALDFFNQNIAAGGSATVNGITVRVAAAATVPAVLSIGGPTTGFVRYKERGTAGIGTLVNVDATTALDLIPGQDNTSNTNYDVWYLPASTVNGVGGATENAFYDFQYFQWNPSVNGSQTIAANQIDADGVIITGIGATTYNNSTVTPAASLDSGVAEFVLAGPNTYNASEGQGIAVKVLQSDLYLQAVANANLNNAQRLITFGQGLTITYNGGQAVTDREFIRFSAVGQRTIGGAQGFATTPAGTGQDTFQTVIGPDLINVQASLADIQNLGQGVSRADFRQDMVDMLNQQSDNIQGANVPGKGLLGTPARVTQPNP